MSGTDETRYRVEALGSRHDRSGFSCGSPPLDQYLRTQAGQDARKRVAAPFVLCEGRGYTVLGYYTLSAVGVDIGKWPETVAEKLPRYPVVPATLLGRLAIDRRFQGHGAGEYLLMDALHRSVQASRQVAALAVIVDAKGENAVAFYRRYEFIPFADQPTRLFLPMRVIEKVFP
ncbi:MAG: GNAT family N-acetyltransferase [Nitrospiria bacterium]